MRPDLSDELATFRREVKEVLNTALTETDAPLVVSDLKRASVLPQPPTASVPRSTSCQVCVGADANDMGAVDRELALLEQSNAALFAALARTRAVPSRVTPTGFDARTLAAREEARAATRLREAARIEESERRRRAEKRQLVGQTRDLKRMVQDLEKQKVEMQKRLEAKSRRRARCEAEDRRRAEEIRREQEAELARERLTSTEKEAQRLRAKLRARSEQDARTRAREALWRWRACAAVSAAARQRKERFAAEGDVAAASAGRSGRRRSDAADREVDREDSEPEARRSGDTHGPWAQQERQQYEGVYAGGGYGYSYGYAAAAGHGNDDHPRSRDQWFRHSHGASASTTQEAAVKDCDVQRREPSRPRLSAGRRLGAIPSDRTLELHQQGGGAAAAAASVVYDPRLVSDARDFQGVNDVEARVTRESTPASGRKHAHLPQALPSSSGDVRVREGNVRNRVAGGAPATAIVFLASKAFGRARRRAAKRAFRRWRRASEESKQKEIARQSAVRHIVARFSQRSRQLKARAWQQWRLNTTTAALDSLRRQQRRRLLRRGGALVEAVFRRRQSTRLAMAFRRWVGVAAEIRRTSLDTAAEVRSRQETAASTIWKVLLEFRRKRLRQGLVTLRAVTRAAAEKERQIRTARSLVAREQHTARKLLLTKCWVTWKGFTATSKSSRRTQLVEQHARRMVQEQRIARAERLVWILRSARASAESRRKARAWRLWLLFKRRTDRRVALTRSVLSGVSKRSRMERLRTAMRKWAEVCAAQRKQEAAALELRSERLQSLPTLVESARVPQTQVTRAFRTWLLVAQTRKVEFLQKRQAVRILFAMLRSARRNALVKAMDALRLLASSAALKGRNVQRLTLRLRSKQRLFFLSKAWSRWLRAAGERETDRVRQLGAARAVHRLLASAVRVSRRRAWSKWREAAAGSAAAAERLENARLAALQRCARAGSLREERRAWGALRSRAVHARGLKWAATRLEGTLLRARRRALSRRLGLWRSATVARALHARERRAAGDRRRAGVLLLASACARAGRRRLERGWHAWASLAASARRAEEELVARSQRLSLLAQRVARSGRRRQLDAVWTAWRALLVQRAVRHAVGAATSSLEGQRAALSTEVRALKQERGLRLMASVADRGRSTLLRSRWQMWRRSTRASAIVQRVALVASRCRARRLSQALHRWRVTALEARAAGAHAGAERAALLACLCAARRREMRPAWQSWRELIAEERQDEENYATYEEGLFAFASVVTRVAKRRDRGRRARAWGTWRLAAVRSTAASGRREAAEQFAALVGRSAETEARLGVGARIALRWLHRRVKSRQLEALLWWRAFSARGKTEEEREARRAIAAACFARDLVRAVGAGRDRRLRRSLQIWRRGVEHETLQAASSRQDARSKQTAAQRLRAVFEFSLLRRKARAWARLVGKAVAVAGRVEQEHADRATRAQRAAAVEARASRRLLAKAWLAWKGGWVYRKHQRQVQALRAAAGAAALGRILRQSDKKALERGLVSWRSRMCQARQRERTMIAAVSFLSRSRAWIQRYLIVRSLHRWRFACAMAQNAASEQRVASAQSALREQKILTFAARKRQQRLGEGFRSFAQCRAMAQVSKAKHERARYDFFLGLRMLRRFFQRRSQKRIANAFARWRCLAADIGQRQHLALLASVQRRAGAHALGAIFARHEHSVSSRAWGLWRSSVVSATVHDGERASADLRVTCARHSAGVRLLATTLCGARRRILWKAWALWCKEAKAAADGELRSMEMHFHLARTLTRIERRNELARMAKAWHTWGLHVRAAARLSAVFARWRRARLADGLYRWRLGCIQQRHATLKEVETATRARALLSLARRRSVRQLRGGFNRLVEHGAWAIYWSREEEARRERLSQGFQILGRAHARWTQRNSLIAFTTWRRVAAETRREKDVALLQAAGKRAGVAVLVSVVSRKERAGVSRVWALWTSGVRAAAIHDGERSSADLRVYGARRSAGARLLAGVLVLPRRRVLARAWSVWRAEVQTAADAELRTMEKHFHLVRTLTRMEKRAQLAQMGRAWRAWRDIVRVEGEAEVHALERHYHVAQTVARVARRAMKRRMSRAWGIWARQAARGLRPGASATRSSLYPAPDMRAALRESAAASSAAARLEERVKRSSAVRLRAGAVVVRGRLRRAEVESLSCAWQAWRRTVETDARREARVILGATRLDELAIEIAETHRAHILYRRWMQWVAFAAAEGARLERAREEEAWASAEAQERKARAVAAGARVFTATLGTRRRRAVARCFEIWSDAARSSGRDHDDPNADSEDSLVGDPETPGVEKISTENVTGSSGRHREGVDVRTSASPTSPPSAASVLRRKLRARRQPPVPADTFPMLTSPGQSPGAATPFSQGARGAFSLQTEAGAEAKSCQNPQPRLSKDENVVNIAVSTAQRGQAWWGDYSDSSSQGSPAMHDLVGGTAAAAADPVTGEARLAALEETDDDHGSLGLSSSPGSFSALRFTGAAMGDNPSPSGRRTMSAAMSAGGGSGSSSNWGSFVSFSDGSPLLGESFAGALIGDDGSTNTNALRGTPSVERAFVDGSPRIAAESPISISLLRPTSGTPSSARTPGRRGSRRTSGKSARLPKSPPYVGGSVRSLLPLGGREPPAGRDGVDVAGERTDQEQAGLPAVLSSLLGQDEDEALTTEEASATSAFSRELDRLLPPPEGGDGAGRVGAFVARISVVLLRRAFRRWERVHRDCTYRQNMMGTKRNVDHLRRKVKLRRAVVSAIRRQSYAWHINDVTRAMRKWREFVRKCADDDRLGLEISRISVASPMTPQGARLLASGLLASAGTPKSERVLGAVEATGGTSIGRREEGAMPFARGSSYSLSNAANAPLARRLWDDEEV